MKKLWRLLLKLEVLVLAAILGTVAGCPVPAPKYGPGPMLDCSSYASTITEFLATPATILVGEQVLFTVEMDLAAGERASYVSVDINPPGMAQRMRDDGTGGDAVPDDDIFSLAVTDAGQYPFDTAGTYEATVNVSLDADGFNYCERSATTDVDVN